MSYEINNFVDNSNIRLVEKKGNIQIIEYIKDLSVDINNAQKMYFASHMELRQRQALVTLENDSFIISAGAMQWILGDINIKSDVKGVGDVFGKLVKGSVTSESAVKPKYYGTGNLMLEPTYKHLLIEDVSTWRGGMVLEDGMFLGCQGSVKESISARKNISSAVFGKEGFFNLKLEGKGFAVIESPVPRNELIEINLNNDVMKIDGNMAIAWSGTLSFTVEKSTKHIAGSIISGEGLVNVYRGTGKILMMPLSNQYSEVENLVNNTKIKGDFEK